MSESITTETLEAHRQNLVQQSAEVLASAAALAGAILERNDWIVEAKTALGAEYTVSAVMLPWAYYAGKYYKTELGLPRKQVARFRLRYVDPDVIASSGRRIVPPDQASIVYNAAALGETEVDRQFHADSTPLVTVSGGNVQIYGELASRILSTEFESVSAAPCHPRHFFDEHLDWRAFRAYPAEALTPEMVEHHSQVFNDFTARMIALETALDDPELNP